MTEKGHAQVEAHGRDSVSVALARQAWRGSHRRHPMTQAHATTDSRESRLRRSLRRLGYDLVDAERGNFYIRREGSKVNETADLFGLDLAGVEQWIREQAKQ